MKNLFKNLMLVAVAAMAFTACQNDNNEVNEVNRVTRYEFTANIADDTRSGFAEKEEGATAYKSEWFGNETLKLFVTDYQGYYVETTATVNTDGEFTLELENAPESFYMTIVSPAESWSSQYNSTIPAEQTPRANSVAPVAHILKAQNVYVTNGSADAVNMGHEVAYGKMTVNAPEGFVIDNVVVNLKGTYYQNYERECTYTINADNVQNNVFWFTTETFENVTEFTVTAYDAEGHAVAKTVDVAEAGKTMSFAYGRVGTFSVSNLEAIEVKPEAPKTLVFTSASWKNDNASDKLVQFYTEDGATLQLNWYKCGSDNWIVPNTYGFASSGAIYWGGQFSWYENSAFEIDAEISAGTVVVSVVDGKYHIEFTNLADWDGNVYIESATFTGLISGLQVPDMRTKLAAPSNITSSVDGKTITLSWDAVEGANGYRVKLYSPYEEYKEEIVTTNEYVYEAQLYSKQYSFTIMSYANDQNTQYRSSDDAYAYVTTGKDPSIWADVVANNIVWDSSNGAFKMTGEVVSGTAWGHSGDYIRIYINESDRPGNNSIKVGTYTGCGGKNPQIGQFGAKLYLYWGTTTYESAFGSTSKVEVSYDETEGYTIVLTHNNITYGYKGMPEGWVAPSAGGEQPDQPDQPDQPSNELGSESNPYTFASVASNGFFLNFEGAENGASLQLDRHSSDVNKMSNLGGPFALNNGTIIYAGSGNIYNVNGTVYSYAQFAPYSTLEVTKANGNWTCKLKMSVDGGATFTYYTYTGQIANQAY